MTKLWHSLFAFLLMVATALVMTLHLESSQNTLLKNAFWTPYRASFYGMLSGGIESLLSRQPVAGGKLRTHHQRVFSKEALAPKTISFKFRLNHDETFVEVLFNVDESGYEAIRISKQAWNPLFHYRAAHSGEILWRKNYKLNVPNILPLEAELKQLNNKLFFFVFGNYIEIDSKLRPGKIGFDLSYDTSIWNPEILLENGKVIEAPFSAPENTSRIFIFNFLICVPVILFFYFLKIPFLFSMFIAAGYIFDEFYYAKQTFIFDTVENTFHTENYQQSFDYENLRFRFFRKWYRLASGNQSEPEWEVIGKTTILKQMKLRFCRKGICEYRASEELPPKTDGVFRLMIWGGSMSVGSGLRRPEDCYAELLHQNLNRNGYRIETLNASRMLNTFDQLQGHLFRDIEKFKPDLLLVDAFIWDNSVEDFRKTFPHLSQLVPKIILMRIPFNYDRNAFITRQEHMNLLKKGLQEKFDGTSAFLKYDPLILKWTRQYKIDFIDPNLRILSDDVYYGGHLFWDAIHITEYGHKHWADFVTEKIRPYILK